MRFAIVPALGVLAALLALLPYQPALAVGAITVDTTSDANVSDSELSIREAILLANGGMGASGLNRALSVDEADNVSGTAGAASVDTITFSDPPFPAGTPGVITINAVLPSLLGGNDIVDGTGRGVILDGAGEPSAFNCLNVESNNNVVKGLRITDCSIGILVLASGTTIGPEMNIYDTNIGLGLSGNSLTVRGNRIGTTSDGSAIHPDGGNNDGIQISGDNSTIGGVLAADRNIISGHNAG
ncbi:MAG: hypothetical protein ACREUU_20300, partial [Gammaproteobacteria bacterium]